MKLDIPQEDKELKIYRECWWIEPDPDGYAVSNMDLPDIPVKVFKTIEQAFSFVDDQEADVLGYWIDDSPPVRATETATDCQGARSGNLEGLCQK